MKERENSELEERFVAWWEAVEPEILASGASFLQEFDSHDIAQLVAFSAWQQFAKFSTFEEFRRWTKIRTRWTALDRYRLAHRKLKSIDLSPHFLDQIAVSPNDERLSTDIEELRSAITQLTDPQAKVIAGRLLGMSYQEIASNLQIKVATARSHFRHAKERLLEIYGNEQ